MKKLLTILLFILCFNAFSQINERITLDWLSQVTSGVYERNDTIFLLGGGTNLSGESHLFGTTLTDDFLVDSLKFPNTQYYLPSSSIYKGNELQVGTNSFSNGHNFIICTYNVITHSLQLDSFDILGVEAMQIYDAEVNSEYSNFFAGAAFDAVEFESNGFIVKTSGIDTLWTKKYTHPELEVNFSGIKKISEDRMLVGGRIYDWDYNWQTIPEHKWDDVHHTYIAEMDTSGNIIWEWHDTTNFTWMPYAITPTSDGGIIYSTQRGFKNEFNGISSGNYLTKLNSSLEKEWEIQLGNLGGVDIGEISNRISEFTQVNDSTYVLGGNGTNYIEGGTPVLSGMIIKFTESGNINWRRDIVPPIVEDSVQLAVIYDMTQTTDGGYALVGESRDIDGIGAYQQGWLVKTNCLGFLASPSAACYAGNADNFEMVFYNNSLNGGEFEWDFGDGQSFTSGEGDTVNHTYADAGPYNVRLIAKGCNGEADTIYFDVNPSVASIEEAIEHGEGTFDLYPNPANDRVYVSINLPFESLPSATSGRTLEIVDINGKVHQTIPVYKNTYTQEVNISGLPKGIYFVNLFNDKGLIKSRKLVVQ